MSPSAVPASLGQRLLWLLDHYRGADGTLNCPLLARLHGPVYPDTVGTALTELARRHESLRTTFRGRGRDLEQVLHDAHQARVTSVDLRRELDPEGLVRQAVTAEVRTRIDPVDEPVRVTLWRIGDREHVLCLNMHHLVTDVWSNVVVYRQLLALLDRATGGTTALDPVDCWQYREFSTWQAQMLARGELQDQFDYWKRELAGAELPRLPRRGPDGGTARRTASVTNLVIGPDAMSALRDIARADRATLFSVLLGVFYVLLHRRTGQTDLAVSSVFANRTRREVQNTVGFLANMAILRTGLPIHGDFHDVVRSTHRTVVDAVANQAVPYRLLEPVHGGGAGDVVFQMVAEPDRIAGTGGVRGEVFVSHHLTSRFDLELALIPGPGTLRAFFFSADDRFEAGFVGELLADYVSLASVLAADPAVPAVGAG